MLQIAIYFIRSGFKKSSPPLVRLLVRKHTMLYTALLKLPIIKQCGNQNDKAGASIMY